MSRLASRVVPVLMLLASLLLASFAGLAPTAGRPVAAIFPPWWNATQVFEAVARAGGPFIRFGAFPFIAVTVSPDPAVAARLRAAGAFLVLDAQALGGCVARKSVYARS